MRDEEPDERFEGRAVSGGDGSYADGDGVPAEEYEEVEATGTSREELYVVLRAEPFGRRANPDSVVREVGRAVTGAVGTGGMAVCGLDRPEPVERATDGTGADTAAAADAKERTDDDALDGRRPRPGLREDGGSCSF